MSFVGLLSGAVFAHPKVPLSGAHSRKSSVDVCDNADDDLSLISMIVNG